jgi:HK97 family phage prohead protease
LPLHVRHEIDGYRVLKNMRDLNRELANFSLRRFDKPLLEIKRSAVGTEIRGYASVFGTTDDQGEVVDPGAFTASLAQHRRKGTMPLMFWSHSPAEIPGYWTNMVEDHKGLLATGRILSSVQRGKEAIALIEAGAVNGLSVGFRTIRDRIINRKRHLVQLDLVEVSLVSLPSNARLMITGREL